MARTLYRIYLYLVTIIALGVLDGGLTILLSTLLLQTPLRGAYESAPEGTQLVQQVVLGAALVGVSLLLGGLHYWLIWRDIQQDPNAARGGVRSLALNFTQAGYAIITMSVGVAALSNVGRSNYGVSAGTTATAIVAVVLLLLVQLERGRSQPTDGAPRVFQHIHLYLVQLILLIFGLVLWIQAVGDAIAALFASVGVIGNPCSDTNSHFYIYPNSGPIGFTPVGYQAPVCDYPGALTGEWLALLWVAALFVSYLWLARNDRGSVLRQIAQLLGFTAGTIAAIVGIGITANFVLQGTVGGQALSVETLVYQFDFIPALVFGAAVVWGYRFQLDREASATRFGTVGTDLTMLALATLALGVPFYIGAILVLQGLVEQVVPNGAPPSAASWATNLAVLVAGIAYPVVAQVLRRRTTETAPVGPRRAIVLAGLAAGALMVAIGGAAALYLVITAQLGSPTSPDWPHFARQAGVVVLVGLFLVGLHLSRLLTDRKPVEPVAPLPAPTAPLHQAPAASIERVLDDLLAGRITREQAAAQLRAQGIGQTPGR